MPFSLGARKLSDLRDVDLAGQAQGDILYKDASKWKRLPPDTGKRLKSQGPGNNPTWAPSG